MLTRGSTLALLMGSTFLAPPRPVAAAELDLCPDEKFGPGARCGTFTVYEDRAAGTGRTLDLNIVLMPATGPEVKEPLFMLAGGPGQAATDLAVLALQPFAPVREHRDVVLVDQRGTGKSNRIDCPVEAEETPQSVFGNLFDPDQVRECLQQVRTHADPTFYTTDLVVDDLDAVRDWLGYEQVLLWGGSGGTRTALVWLRRHPDRVAGALLDGVTPTDFRAPSTYARGCQDALDQMFADCRQQEACHTAFPDLEADFAKLAARFENGPVSTQITDGEGKQVPIEMYLGDFGYAVRGLIYRSRTLAKLPAMIHLAATTDDLGPFAQAYWQRQVGLRPIVAMGVHFSIFCSEDLRFIGDENVEGFTKDTFLGTYLFDQYSGACEEWEVAEVDESFLGPVKSDVPVLLFSGHYDPSTTVALAEQVASHLPNSRHVVVRNESHGSEFGCGRQLAIDFMTSGSLDGLGPTCDDAGPIQFETP